ncbi:MAG: hypothetical protein ACREXM_06870 [Gammaproteobacteria bacterium]
MSALPADYVSRVSGLGSLMAMALDADAEITWSSLLPKWRLGYGGRAETGHPTMLAGCVPCKR